MPMPRKANLLHNLHGSTPHDRAADVSGVPGGRPKIPNDISALGLRKPFKAMCRLLQERRVLTNGDVELIRVFCIVQDRHIRNSALLREEGELVTYVRLDSNGQPHPQVKKNLRHDICVTAERQITAIVNQLGLTPTAKDRAKVVSAASTREVVPGSVEELYPELFIVKESK
jgi:P27 family predicted phage terminase small subunit